MAIERGPWGERCRQILQAAGMADERHTAYLGEEIDELDATSSWQDIEDHYTDGVRSLNPDGLLCAWLLGIARCNPLWPRVFLPTADDHEGWALNEPGYMLELDGQSEVPLYKRSTVLIDDQGPLPADALRPSMCVGGRRITRIFPASSKFVELQTADRQTDACGLVHVPQTAVHRWKQSNEFPDIDVDFGPAYLERITEWAKQRHGAEYVVGVCTYQRFSPKSTLKAVARVYELSFSEINRMTAALGDEADKMKWPEFVQAFDEVRALLDAHPRMAWICERLQTRISNVGTHPSALVISSVPIAGRIPLIRQPSSGVITSSWVEGQNRTDLSTFGFVKFDRLGIKTLDDIQRCLELIYGQGLLDREQGIFRQPLSADWDPQENMRFPEPFRMLGTNPDWSDERYLDDPRALALAAEGRTNGVFQFDSPGIRRMLRDIRIERFTEMTAANAMYRPGVLKATVDGVAGGHTAYIGRKHGQIEWSVPEILREDLEDTYGLMIYQEQVMAVLRKLGGIPMGVVNDVRSAISKKKMAKVVRVRSKFAVNAARILGWTEEQAGKWFDDNIIPWSGYGFNKSHSLAYAILAMRTLYLKAYYPVEFFCAFLTGLKRDKQGYERLRTYAADAIKFDVEILGCDINQSHVEYVVCREQQGGRRAVRMGFGHVKHIGKAAQALVDGQPYASFEDFLDRVKPTAAVCESLVHAGAFDVLQPNRRRCLGYYERWRKAQEKGVGRKLYDKFLRAVGYTGGSRKNPDLMREFVALLTGSRQRPPAPEAQPEFFGQSPEQLDEQQPAQEALAAPPDDRLYRPDFREGFGPQKPEGEEEEESRGRRFMPYAEFEAFVHRRWVPDADSTLLTAIDVVLEQIAAEVPRVDWEEEADFTFDERVHNSVAAYGAMMPFDHPMCYAQCERLYIRDWGEKQHAASSYPQDAITVYVMAVNHVYMTDEQKTKRQAQTGIKPRGRVRVQVDDGYEQTWVTVWEDTWYGRRLRETYEYDAGELVAGEGPTGQGQRPCDLLRKGATVKMRVEYDERWGFRLSQVVGCVEPISMCRQFMEEAKFDVYRPNQQQPVNPGGQQAGDDTGYDDGPIFVED